MASDRELMAQLQKQLQDLELKIAKEEAGKSLEILLNEGASQQQKIEIIEKLIVLSGLTSVTLSVKRGRKPKIVADDAVAIAAKKAEVNAKAKAKRATTKAAK